MKKILAVALFICCAAFLVTIAGCSQVAEKIGIIGDKGKSYSETMNEKLVSFTDCANALCDSLERIADRTYAPTDSQTADIQDTLDAFGRACGELAGQKAPAEYSVAQEAMNEAMENYADAIEKCGALLEFYGAYDDMFRKYKDPAEGKAAIEKNERALYEDFANAMKKADDSFRTACEKFDSVNKQNNSEE